MKTLKSVTLLESKTGDERFAVKAAVPGRASNPDVPKAGGFATFGARTSGKTYEHSDKSGEVAAEIASDIKSSGNKYLRALNNIPNSKQTAKEVADTPGQDTGGGAPPNSTVSDVVSVNSVYDVLSGIISRNDPRKHSELRCNIYRDIFYHDATSGSTIELLSTLPFSDFSLTGLKDEKMTNKFVESIEAMNCSTLLPNISIDYYCLGGAVLSTRWNESEKSYSGVVPHRLDYCTFKQVPVFGIDPHITVRLPDTIMEGLKDKDIVDKYRDYIPLDLLEQFIGDKRASASEIELKPENTIFIPRRAFLKDFSGISLLQRVLPAWLYEKALIRGTIDQVYKRQRATGHITVEHSEDFSPTQDQLNAIAQMFMNADLDPLGAVVVTRSGVNYNEVRRGDDFWRWDQNYDAIEKIKLRALGISESFVTGEASYSTMEQTLSVFMEGIRDYRNRITREMFYEKVFPHIAHANGYTRKRYGSRAKEVSSYGKTGVFYNEKNELYATIGSDYPIYREMAANNSGFNPSDYVIPQVVWHKRLMPEADSDYLAILATLEEHGIPISIRHWVASGGMPIESLMNGLEEDLELRTQILEYKQQISELEKEFGVKQEGEGGEGEGLETEEFANFLAARKFGIGGVRRTSILGRGNPDMPEAEIADYDSQGHRRVMTRRGRQYKLNRYNKVIAEAAAEVARKENSRSREEASKRDVKTKYYI